MHSRSSERPSVNRLAEVYDIGAKRPKRCIYIWAHQVLSDVHMERHGHGNESGHESGQSQDVPTHSRFALSAILAARSNDYRTGPMPSRRLD
jgi:hypothetical protein